VGNSKYALAAAATSFLIVPYAGAQTLYKCVGDNGSVSYQKTECAGAGKKVGVNIPSGLGTEPKPPPSSANPLGVPVPHSPHRSRACASGALPEEACQDEDLKQTTPQAKMLTVLVSTRTARSATGVCFWRCAPSLARFAGAMTYT
jgi:hypothetical protein